LGPHCYRLPSSRPCVQCTSFANATFSLGDSQARERLLETRRTPALQKKGPRSARYFTCVADRKYLSANRRRQVACPQLKICILKIVTFNINNINKRLDNLVAWLAKTEPDVVCLQELKAEQRAFPEPALRDLGYRSVWQGERSWNGVAILARDCEPVLTRSSLPGNSEDGQPEDRQARYIEAAVNGVLITSIYLPNGNPQPGPKFNYKLAWFERLIAHAASLIASGPPVVLAGDYNVVPTEQDIYPTRSLDNNALIQPRSRQAFARLMAQGWTDALRKLQPEGPLWTFWDYERDRWSADKGMRLDHFLLSPVLRERLVDGGVDRWVRGEDNASDHAPAWIVLDL
jgi:exodeoxyribonuclease-3